MSTETLRVKHLCKGNRTSLINTCITPICYWTESFPVQRRILVHMAAGESCLKNTEAGDVISYRSEKLR